MTLRRATLLLGTLVLGLSAHAQNSCSGLGGIYKLVRVDKSRGQSVGCAANLRIKTTSTFRPHSDGRMAGIIVERKDTGRANYIHAKSIYDEGSDGQFNENLIGRGREQSESRVSRCEARSYESDTGTELLIIPYHNYSETHLILKTDDTLYYKQRTKWAGPGYEYVCTYRKL